MYRHRDEMGYWNNEFDVGVDSFLDFAFSQTDSMFCAKNMIRCPCTKCLNREWHHRPKVRAHLITNGFMDGATVIEDVVQFGCGFEDASGGDESIFEEPRGDAKKFFDLLQAAETPLFDGCDDGVTISKKFESQCYLECPVCGEPQFKQSDVHSAKPIARKSLWYLPIIPRLQRLYMSRKTTEHMIWHLNCCNENEKIVHPACGDAWKHFDRTHPDFANEPSNVRLGLCTDGFTPFGQSASPYSCWPVFVSIYNLPPAMCMKEEYVFLSLIIQGPQSPGKNIDVMLRPLIDDLKQLWYSGVQTYDSFRHQYFLMRVAIMWTTSDFPRRMHCLKLTVKNKARPEASICESYIMSEITNFISHYFDEGVDGRSDRPSRNIVGGFDTNCGLSIFTYVGKPIGSKIMRCYLTAEECKAASYYLLMNCEELRRWVKNPTNKAGAAIWGKAGGMEEEILQGTHGFYPKLKEPRAIKVNPRQLKLEKGDSWLFLTRKSKQFAPTKQEQPAVRSKARQIRNFLQGGKVRSDEFINVHEHIKGLSSGPKNTISCYNGYIVNGFRFQTATYGKNKRTMNYGFCVVGSIRTESDYDFYGVLQGVIQIEYFGSIHRQAVVLFKCDWYEIPPAHGVRVDQKHRLVDINPRRYLRAYEPFILASQANHEEGLAPYYQDDDPSLPHPINIYEISYELVQYYDGTLVEVHEEVDDKEEIGEKDDEGEWEDFETFDEENMEAYISENDSSDE
ncbi:hypothetical protein SLEP1_g42409 [Rubroshorea leprosula]|uniref:Transposase n=1 Tax=Rubroshorea leprosula TaxID=152421 RepID=A0AAV5LA55_9ROSI|nr:hypothetical protein SLEP1_g42409 [Rubroshorea leprosula]